MSKYIGAGILVALFIVSANTALATHYRGFINWGLNPLTGDTIIQLAENFADFAMFFGSILVGIAVIWAGLRFVTAGADSAKVNSAKQILKNGVIGGVVLFAVGIIVNTLIELVTNPTTFF